jgi:hypothetical protein
MRNYHVLSSFAFQGATRRWRSLRAALCLPLFVGGFGCSTEVSIGPEGLPNASGPFATDPNRAALIVSDLGNFWAAYDEYHRTGASSAFQTLYLDRASPGLKDFMRSRSLTAATLATVVGRHPRYYAAVRTVSSQLESGEVGQQIRGGYARMKAIYPAAVFPSVTFLMGRFSTGGTTARNRILIGTEFYLADPGVPVDELSTFARSNVHPLAFLPVIVAHEHVHILQQQAMGIFGRKTLLEQSVLEGGADFIGELVSGANINEKVRAWAIPREHALWVEFQAAMNGTDVSAWLYNQGSATADRPGDLGYFIGYRIAEAYYAKAIDKRQAVKDIIEVRNATTYLGASGYNP